MMATFTKDENNGCLLFDARDDTLSLALASTDTAFDLSESVETNSNNINQISRGLSYDLWIQTPRSVEERRNNFFSWLGWSSDNSSDVCSDILEQDVVDDGITTERESCFSMSSISNRSNGGFDTSKSLSLSDDYVLNANDLCKSGELHVMIENDEKIEEKINFVGIIKRVKKDWLSRLRSLACVVNRQVDSDSVFCGKAQSVRVHQSKKKLKELSALYMGQDIQAHKGSILTMKFSVDGQYLASAGEDGIMRLWQVMEDDTSNRANVPNIDLSCMYFTVNHLSELAPFPVDEEKISKLQNSDSACVIFPPKVFRILEKPLHEFHGHNDTILDLTWSKNNYLLSASVDKTVRLWRVGCDHCLKVFTHSDYVTCVQFNPVDEDHFISGSIDGKVRNWAIPSCQVVGWTDVKEIVTAVCYRPNAKGGIVGSMRGNCRFFNVSDNHLQLDTEVCLQSKKKSLCKRITSFQFLPQDSSKVMVTCADSQVRILDGTNVIGKYRGHRNAGNNVYASVTSDGKHIVSACDDSSVYLWNCISSEMPSQPKMIRSFERFSTNNASLAIPWCGIKKFECNFHLLNGSSHNTRQFFSPACFSLSQECCLLESFYRGGSATWPEEKLPNATTESSSSSSSICKSQYKYLKKSWQSTSTIHAWGLVIVTAGSDGRIRSFLNYGLPLST